MRVRTAPANQGSRQRTGPSKCRSPGQQQRQASEDAPPSPRLAYLSRKALGPHGLERLSTAPAAGSPFAATSPHWAIKAGAHLTDESASDAGLMRLFASSRRSTDLEAASGRDSYPADLLPRPAPAPSPSVSTTAPPAPAEPAATPAEQAAASPASTVAAVVSSAWPTLDLELSPEEAQWLVRPLLTPRQAVLELVSRSDGASSRSLCAAKLGRLRRKVASTAKTAGSWLAGKSHAAVCGVRSGVAVCARKVGKLQAACMSPPAVQ